MARKEKKGDVRTGSTPKSAARGRVKLAGANQGPLYQQVQDYIRAQIDSGKWPSGHRLATLRQISGDLNLAYATVARAIGELVREGVLDAHSGRGIHVAAKRKKRMQTIGILGFASYQNLLQTTRYYRRLLMLLQEKIIERGQTVVYSHWRQDKPLEEMFDGLKMVDGLLIFSSDESRKTDIEKLLARSMPLICLGDSVRRSDGIPAIHSANEDDSRRAIKLLQNMGHRHIACLRIGAQGSHAGIEARLVGYRHAMTQSAAGYDPKYELHDEAGALAGKLLAIDPRPTAVFIPNGVGHFGILHDQLLGTPLEMGKKLLPCAYDENLWDTISATGIRYVTVEPPLVAIAEQGVDHLLHSLEDDSFHPGYVEIPSTIIMVNEDGSRRGL